MADSRRQRRILKRHLSDVIHRRMLRDLRAERPPDAEAAPLPLAA